MYNLILEIKKKIASFTTLMTKDIVAWVATV